MPWIRSCPSVMTGGEGAMAGALGASFSWASATGALGGWTLPYSSS
jgi:hypothetical protein